jgi:cytochrome oxidase Cu insertion factor (SCO1/SenC/PrrC family)
VSRAKLILIFSLFALPVLASYLTYYFWQPSGRKNYGELIAQVGLRDGQDQTGHIILSAQDFKGKWTLVYVGRGTCDKRCETLLYYMRQVRSAQGPERDRINRLWLVTDGKDPAAALLAQHPGLTVVRLQDPVFLTQFAGAASGRHVYVVDPLGNLMMRFPANPDPSRMIRDLKQLLKASQIG